MNCETIHLKELFPALGLEGRDPTVEVMRVPTIDGCGKKPRPHRCLVVCPGGGYAGLSDRESWPVAFPFAAQGFHVLILNYSVSPHRFPVQLQEVAAVLELICRNAQAWNADPQRVAIMGFSAGGHLACHYSNDYACDQVRALFPESKPVQAAVLGYPVITAREPDCHLGSFRNLLGQDPDEDQARLVSLEERVTEATPPTFLWHTAADELVPVANTYRYAAALAHKGVPAEVHVYPLGAHGLATVGNATVEGLDPFTARAAAWLDQANAFLEHYLPEGGQCPQTIRC